MESKNGPAAHQRAKGANLFIPISLGNHYYSSVVLRNLMDNFISSSDRSIILLCDRLRFLSYCIRGELDIKGINSRIQIQIGQMKRTLDNLGLGSHPNAFVADWSFLEEDHRYGELLASLRRFVQADREVGECLNDRVATLIDRFYRRETSELVDSRELQRQYIMAETALSLFMTEIRGYNVELYRRGMGFVDYLYSRRSDELKSLTGNSVLKRKFIAIEQ